MIEKSDGLKRLEKLKETGVFTLFDNIAELEPAEIVLAGGAIRSIINDEIPEDWDLFIVGRVEQFEANRNDAVAWFDGKPDVWENVFRCPEKLLFTYKLKGHEMKVQLICLQGYSSIQTLRKSFDFDVCHGVYIQNTFDVPPETLWSIKNRRVMLTNLTYPLGTMNRLFKYKQKGYNIADAQKTFLELFRTGEFTDEAAFRVYID